jgi:hypothetical protein
VRQFALDAKPQAAVLKFEVKSEPVKPKPEDGKQAAPEVQPSPQAQPALDSKASAGELVSEDGLVEDGGADEAPASAAAEHPSATAAVVVSSGAAPAAASAPEAARLKVDIKNNSTQTFLVSYAFAPKADVLHAPDLFQRLMDPNAPDLPWGIGAMPKGGTTEASVPGAFGYWKVVVKNAAGQTVYDSDALPLLTSMAQEMVAAAPAAGSGEVEIAYVTEPGFMKLAITDAKAN